MSGEESDAATQDLWLTYQEYDPAVKQAVRRLGALPGNNVEEFRKLFLASRERKRVKEFEDVVVRRLQGDAFVGDEVLQQTLIVLHAENPQLAEQFKQFVAANGRPEDIDLTVARLRSGTDNPVMPERLPRKPREAAQSFIAPEPAAEAPKAAETPAPAANPPVVSPPVANPSIASPSIERPRPTLVASGPAETAPASLARPADESEGGTSWIKYAAAIAAVLLIGAGGYFALAPKSTQTISVDKPFEATTAPLRQATAEPAPQVVPAPPAAKSTPEPAAHPTPAQSAPPAVAEAHNATAVPAAPLGAESLQAAPAAEQARGNFQPPAQQAVVPTISRNGPVAGSDYKVVRGDRLSVIARQIYGDPSLYLVIQRANPAVQDADLIYSDQVIFLPPKP